MCVEAIVSSFHAVVLHIFPVDAKLHLVDFSVLWPTCFQTHLRGTSGAIFLTILANFFAWSSTRYWPAAVSQHNRKHVVWTQSDTLPRSTASERIVAEHSWLRRHSFANAVIQPKVYQRLRVAAMNRRNSSPTSTQVYTLACIWVASLSLHVFQINVDMSRVA